MDAYLLLFFPLLCLFSLLCPFHRLFSFLLTPVIFTNSHFILTSLIHNLPPINDVAPPSSSPTLIRATADRVTPGSGGSSGSNLGAGAGPGPGPGPVPSAPRDVVASLVSTRFIKLTWRLPLEPHGDDITYSIYYGLEGAKR